MPSLFSPVSPNKWLPLCAALLCTSSIAGAAQADWQLKYQFDEDRASLYIQALAFPSDRFGIAAGTVNRLGKKPHPTLLVTRDGGEKWSAESFEEIPQSMFFLNDSRGWIVTEGGIWLTEEAGRGWRKIRRQRGLTQVYFITPEHGFACGQKKTVIETLDGGKTWRDLPVEMPATNKDTTIFHTIAFANGKAGTVVGRAYHVSDAQALLRGNEIPERPAVSIFLETMNGGQDWRVSTGNLFGVITRVRYLPGGKSLALFEFTHTFAYPSEVMLMDVNAKKAERVLASKTFVITDVITRPSGRAYAFGEYAQGSQPRSGVPTEVRVLSSADMKEWTDEKVDYRAVANRVLAAVTPSGRLWMATDTGMLLQRVAE